MINHNCVNRRVTLNYKLKREECVNMLYNVDVKLIKSWSLEEIRRVWSRCEGIREFSGYDNIYKYIKDYQSGDYIAYILNDNVTLQPHQRNKARVGGYIINQYVDENKRHCITLQSSRGNNIWNIALENIEVVYVKSASNIKICDNFTHPRKSIVIDGELYRTFRDMNGLIVHLDTKKFKKLLYRRDFDVIV